MRKIKISVIIPTFNAEKYLHKILNKIPRKFETVIIDSSSNDDTVNIAHSYGCIVKIIDKANFNHGATRNLASKIATGDILIYLTQDAVPINENTFKNIVLPFTENDEIGMVYGRQLPHKNAKIMGQFARLHNYPDKSVIKSIEDKSLYGIKTVFCSNSFSAYKREVFERVGMFPENVILGEDTYICAKILLNGYKVAYVAEALVYHSHDYTILEEFKRYFDIGVFYGREKWIIKEFSMAEKEGFKFVLEQFKFLIKNKSSHLIFELFFRNFMKYVGYKLGMNESKLPLFLKRKLSMTRDYWG